MAGAGYLGTELLRHLEEQGLAAWGLRRGGSTADSHAHILNCDITNSADLLRLRAKLGRIDAVVHCASSGHGGAEAYRQIFLTGTSQLFDILAPEHFLFVGSTSVFPQVDGSEVTETSKATGNRETSKILLEAEEMVLAQAGTVVRSSGLYGPGRSVVLKRFLMGEAQIDSKGPAGPLSDGRLLNQIHRDDAASGTSFLLGCRENCRGEVFNLSDGRPMSQGEIYRGLVARFGGSLPPGKEATTGGKRAWTNKAVSSARLQALGWKPRFPDYLTALDTDPRLVPSIREQVTASLPGE